MRLLALVIAAGCATTAVAPPANRAVGTSVAMPGDSIPHAGDPSARVVIVSYFNYRCPHCIAFEPKLDTIAETYGNRVVIYFKWLQLKQWPEADRAAIAALAAHRQRRFFDMHRLLLTATSFEAADLRKLAAKLGLDLARYDRDVADTKLRDRLDQDTRDGEGVEVDHVPMLFINDVEYKGELELPALAQFIDGKLR
ncbi:MAG: thioredoxin domain-containing protein [Kofleriaceae bacterium]